MSDHSMDKDALSSAVLSFLEKLKSGPLCVGVSGGRDSLALLHVLHSVNQNLGENQRELICLTVDHGLREASRDEVLFVQNICNDLGIQCCILRWLGDKPKAGLQKAARNARYRLFADAVARYKAVGVVTAHHLDDQIETIAMRQKRLHALDHDLSYHTRGLAGMAQQTLFFGSLWVLRPLLAVSRFEIEVFLKKRNIQWIDDPSNEDHRFERVRMRMQLARNDRSIPDIERFYQQRFELSQRAAQLIADNVQFYRTGPLTYYFEYALSDIFENKHRLDKKELSAHILLLETLISIVGGRDRPMGRDAREQLRAFIFDQHGKRRMNLGRVVLDCDGQIVMMRRENRNLTMLEILPHQTQIWDNRFHIENLLSNASLYVKIGRDGQISLLKATHSNGLIDAVKDDYNIGLHINRFDMMTSDFDFVLAQALTKLVGRTTYSELPLPAL